MNSTRFFFILALATAVVLVTALPTNQTEQTGQIEETEQTGPTEVPSLGSYGIRCIVHGVLFNGRQTCTVGCRAYCAQSECGGFKKCEPREGRKYECNCQASEAPLPSFDDEDPFLPTVSTSQLGAAPEMNTAKK